MISLKEQTDLVAAFRSRGRYETYLHYERLEKAEMIIRSFKMDYHEREQQKSEAWKLLADEKTSLTIKAQALLRVIDAHYWRAREHLEERPRAVQRRIHGKRYSPGYTLDIDVYTRHWLHANGDIIDPEVIDCVREQWGYEPEPSRFLSKGLTSYVMPYAKIPDN